MERDHRIDGMSRPPLRTFLVRTNPVYSQDGTILVPASEHTVQAHLAFNNEGRGEGYVFRRYYDNDVRTEIVAEFSPGSVQFYKDLTNG